MIVFFVSSPLCILRRYLNLYPDVGCIYMDVKGAISLWIGKTESYLGLGLKAGLGEVRGVIDA